MNALKKKWNIIFLTVSMFILLCMGSISLASGWKIQNFGYPIQELHHNDDYIDRIELNNSHDNFDIIKIEFRDEKAVYGLYNFQGEDKGKLYIYINGQRKIKEPCLSTNQAVLKVVDAYIDYYYHETLDASFECLVLPNVPKTLNVAEAKNALSSYKSGLVLIKTDYSQDEVTKKNICLGILKPDSKSGWELSVPTDQTMKSWCDSKNTITFVYCNSALSFGFCGGEREGIKHFAENMEQIFSNQKNRGKILLLDSSSVYWTDVYENIKNADKEVKDHYHEFLKALAEIATNKGVDAVVILDPLFVYPAGSISGEKGVFYLPIEYGSAKSRGVIIKKTQDGALSATWIDTSQF